MSEEAHSPPGGALTTAARRLGLGTVLSSLLFSSRFVTIWIATGILVIVAEIIAPETLSSASWSIMLPIGSVVAVVALGQMLVIMMGGIDLSMAAAISLLANILVGVSEGENSRLAYALVIVAIWAIVIGLVNGILVAIVELNPLIVTLSTGLILLGVTAEYRLGTANNSSVPDALSDVVFEKTLGISKAFWFVLVLMLIVTLVLRSTGVGRRFQAVGANRTAAWMAGIHVRAHVVAAYVGASLTAAVAGVIIGGIVVNPGVDPGAPYLLGPVAAVVLGGAALSGGLASPTSTWLAAFFITVLNQMLRVLGLTTASQFVVFGLAIILGMIISGDRISDLIGRLLLKPGLRQLIEGEPTADLETAATSDRNMPLVE